MAEEASYTYSESPTEEKKEYQYTYKEPTPIHEVPTHRILHKLRTELPHLAGKIPHLVIGAKKYTPAAQKSILKIAHGLLSGEESLIKMKLEQIKMKEAQGQKLTPYEVAAKERGEKMLQRVQFLKGGVEQKVTMYREVGGQLREMKDEFPTSMTQSQPSSQAQAYFFEKAVAEPYEKDEVSKAARLLASRRRKTNPRTHRRIRNPYEGMMYPRYGGLSERERLRLEGII